MKCQYFGMCGGCSLGHMTYDEQLNYKVNLQKDEFLDFYNKEIDVFRSETSSFRNRAEFRIFHKQGNISYAMSDVSKKLMTIDKCGIVCESIDNIMTKFLIYVQNNDILKQKFFSVEFLSSLHNDILITMIYHKKLDDIWKQEAEILEKELSIKIIGRSRKQKVIVSDDYINETLKINTNTFELKYQDGGFTQPNQNVNIKMIQWVLKNSHCANDLCELYCGGGNFTLPLSMKFDNILATEISKTSIRNAKENCTNNNINNVKFIRMSSAEFVEAKNNVRKFRRLELENVDFDKYNFSTIFVDPPRAGLDDVTLKLCSTFDQIIYISCNPKTLKSNLEDFKDTHKIERFGLFDQFAYTNHIECGVILIRI